MVLRGHSGEGGEARLFRLRAAAAGRGEPAAPRLLRLADSGEAATDPLAHPSHPALLAHHRISGGAAVVPFVRGNTLGEHLAAQGPFRTAHISHIVAVVADALQTLHDSGFAHLDIKPDNIMVDSAGSLMVIDTADIAPADGRPIRRGTPPFTIAGAPASPATDWIALGRTAVMLASQSATTPIGQLAPELRKPIADLLDGRRPRTVVDLDARLDLPALGLIAAHHQPTIDFPTDEPRPAPRIESAAPRRKAIGIAALCVAMVAAVTGLWRPGPTECSPLPDRARVGHNELVTIGPDCSTTVSFGSTTASFDSTTVSFDDTTGVLTVRSGDTTERFGLGQPGDTIVFGDWNCDTEITPGLQRGDQLLVFDHWPQADAVHGRPSSGHDC